MWTNPFCESWGMGCIEPKRKSSRVDAAEIPWGHGAFGDAAQPSVGLPSVGLPSFLASWGKTNEGKHEWMPQEAFVGTHLPSGSPAPAIAQPSQPPSSAARMEQQQTRTPVGTPTCPLSHTTDFPPSSVPHPPHHDPATPEDERIVRELVDAELNSNGTRGLFEFVSEIFTQLPPTPPKL